MYDAGVASFLASIFNFLFIFFTFSLANEKLAVGANYAWLA
jgi:hypothetical protein